ncbi:MFS transporter [Novosphingobium sp. SG720]|uniref:MFS transporter n=1 Tax=Novosphingobium sp. SG720 TaxID=2586998 RepID=UPI001444DA7E|nr:MFS transporter [Novosphingobium sp. SG720]NKJ41005.1 MFS family permease [Novosphingobium sp. SG720]
MAADPMRRVYLHVGLQSFVESSGGLFIAGFLVAQGFSHGMALAAFAGTLLARFALRGLVLPLAWRAGLRTVVLIGVLVRAVSFLLLPFVPGAGPVPAAGMLALFIVVTGLGSVLYWTGWHSFVSALADGARGGRQVSIQQATTAVVGIVAPLVGGLLIARAGPLTGFGAIALVQLAAVLPLIGAPNPGVAREATLNRPLTVFARRLYLSEGFHAGCATVIWNLALFVTLGEHFDAFGGAIAVAGVAAAAGSLLIGHLIDGGRPLHSLALAYGAAILALAAKALAFATPLAAVGATALGALVTPMAATAMLAPLYAMARASSCTLRFNMATEGGWDLGCSLACLIAAGLLEAGAGFQVPILLGLLAVAAIWRMLALWYGRQGLAA